MFKSITKLCTPIQNKLTKYSIIDIAAVSFVTGVILGTVYLTSNPLPEPIDDREWNEWYYNNASLYGDNNDDKNNRY